MKNVKTNRGITLIALVVTIIVLLILAAVTIGLVLGQNGIIGKANKAKSATDIASGKDQVQLALVKVVSDKLEDGKTTSDIKAEELQTELQKTDSSASVTGTNPNFTAKYHVNGIEYEYGINTGTQTVVIEENNQNSESAIKLLIDVVKEGDFINYDAGRWEETKEMPDSEGEYGGYKLGASRNDSIEIVLDGEKYKPMYNGWRVLSVDKSRDVIRLIHAGTPEAYYNATGIKIAEGNLKAYVNSLATCGKVFGEDELLQWGNNYGDMVPEWVRACGSFWWVNATGSIYYSWNRFGSFLMSVEPNGYIWGTCGIRPYENKALGIRPVVTLKSGLKTSGQKEEIVGTDGTTTAEVWQLVKPTHIEFNPEEWDKTATDESYFVWGSDKEGEDGYNTIVGYQKKMGDLYKVRIPSRCTSIEINEVFLGIGNARFDFVTNVSSVEIPGSVRYIGDLAFEHFTNLKTIYIPDSVTDMGCYVFSDCSNLSIAYSDSQMATEYLISNHQNITIRAY